MSEDIYSKKREKLIELLREEGIKDERVLSAMNKVRRECFVDETEKENAYLNYPLSIGYSQTISQPYTVAFMTELLEVNPGDKVLEIGTGSGYQAAILKELGADVYSIERIYELYLKAKENLNKLNYNVTLKVGDGTLGWEEYSPFNKIIVTAGSPKIPDTLFNQLAIGGIMVIPVGDTYSQDMYKVRKSIDRNGKIIKSIETYKEFVFVPLIGKEGWDYDLR
ncbi:MAG: protein-L-isoaspartate(D-aspartate) O-methyltransferase [Ignavibacteria bacterium]|nr:protein-L-isoaspartate(D-aspartate) O-methyltransferase [Ignavibacteria bacterium]